MVVIVPGNTPCSPFLSSTLSIRPTAATYGIVVGKLDKTTTMTADAPTPAA